MGTDLTVVNAARVSFAKRADQFREQDGRLLAYLARHQHWTPFAHPQITLHVKAPIFVRTQCFKHKVGFVENEISRRYVDDAPHAGAGQDGSAAVDDDRMVLDGFFGVMV